ncbi:YDJ1-mitochondrial and ER import protein [Apiospora marii]|uniref:YDJ1-mitochondrial and ER import protein n=2 Tax=Apiospora marii TaxID=335849 RepID=A0ABR1S8E8_9PEZI
MSVEFPGVPQIGGVNTPQSDGPSNDKAVAKSSTGRSEGAEANTGSSNKPAAAASVPQPDGRATDPGSGKGNESTPSKSLDDADENFRAAVEEASKQKVADLRLQLQHDDIHSLNKKLAARKEDKEFRHGVYQAVLEALQKSRTDSKYTEEEVRKFEEETKSHLDAIMDKVISSATKTLENDIRNAEHRFSPQQKRRAKNRVLRLMREGASYYDLLGVKQDASSAEINKAKKHWMLPLHPDKNMNDTEALECSKIIGCAADALCDERKRKQHDDYIKRNPRRIDPFAPDEEFATNAFDADDDSEDEDESEIDSEEEEETTYPKTPKRIQKLHQELGDKVLKGYFKDYDGKIQAGEISDRLSNYNKDIKENNNTHKMSNPLMFTVPLEKIQTCRYQARSILEYYKSGVTDAAIVQKRLQALQDYFVKTQRRGLYQWPEKWTELLMKPLRKQLDILALPKEHAQTNPTAGNTSARQTDSQGDTAMPDAKNTRKTDGKRDTATPDAKNTRKTDSEGDTTMPDATNAPPRELRKLAYSSPPPREDGIRPLYNPFKLFVEVDGPNPLLAKRATEIEAEDEADCIKSTLPNIKEEENDYCGKRSRKVFKRIKGVSWFAETGTEKRTCFTWVWVELHGSNDVHIMTRSTFRRWLTERIADKKIDMFLDENDIIPPWSPRARKDQFPSVSLALVHPLPKHQRKNHLRYDDRYEDRYDDRYDDGYDSGYDNSDDQRHNGGRIMTSRPKGRSRDPEIAELANAMKSLCIAFGNFQTQQTELLQRLLPAPSPR